MKDQLEKNKDITANSKQIELLKQHFPQCFDKNGAFRADKMQELVGGDGVELSKESYSLNWLGKSYARLLANEAPLTLLRENAEHNNKPEHKDSQNLLIKGDNLEVLKHLSNAYREKIKMIYIDPPYNTGNDGFVYQDDRKFTPEQLMKLAGLELDEAQRILDFTLRKANSHSAWLTFMYPRLYIARQLLKDDGVIFISIDDNEQAQLKLLCDEVFGEENFVSYIIWQKKFSRSNDAAYFSTMHDHILCYAKRSKKIFSGSGRSWNLNLLPREKEVPNGYDNPDSDERGVWASVILSAKSGTEKLRYSITTPGGRKCLPPSGRYWSVDKEKLIELVNDKRIWFGMKGAGIPRLKTFLSEVQEGLRPNTIWFHGEAGHNQGARQEVKKDI